MKVIVLDRGLNVIIFCILIVLLAAIAWVHNDIIRLFTTELVEFLHSGNKGGIRICFGKTSEPGKCIQLRLVLL
jgi:hypothetical protein